MPDRPLAEHDWGNRVVEAAARRILDNGLGHGRSTIEPATRSWTLDAAAELRHLIIDNADEGTGTFLQKLADQLSGASRAAHLLAVELLYLHTAPLWNLYDKTKRDRLTSVLSWMQPAPALPRDLDAALNEVGVFNGGAGFNIQVWRQLGWLLSFVEHWWALPEDQRETALRDPWVFRDIVAGLDTGQAGIRSALLYLMFPDTFAPIVNQDHKRAIRDAFADQVGGATGRDAVSIDRDLARIREVHREQAGHVVDWYVEPYHSQWQKLSDESRRAWLVRPRGGGATLVARWLNEGYVSLAATHLAPVEPGADRPTVRAAVEQGYQHVDYAERLTLGTEYFHFLNTMKDDDVVATVVDDQLRVGVVTGAPEYVSHGDDRLRRAVAWSAGAPVGLAGLVEPLPQELARQGTVVDLTAVLPVLADLVVSDLPDDDEPAPTPPQPTGPLVLRPADDDLSRRVNADVKWLQEIIDLLAARRQIVLYGPPGTGKTWLARALAQHVTDADAVRLVQFHPSYAYEDFFEGYRPAPRDDGQVGFALHPGPLRALAAEARSDPGRAHVLVIDEINRANLAKVFGELYFLLEYRDEHVRLQYSPGEVFTLPRNVHVIGTMNTADRSIALVDAAMRRRFAFVEMHPDAPPVDDVLARWLRVNAPEGDERAGLLAALNAEIGVEERDYQIGPSYLMGDEAASPAGLERVWAYSILPLLEEHYYGRLTRAQVRERFGLAAIRARAAGADQA